MILCRTPFRGSLFGGGSDYREWFTRHGGRTLGMAIDKYCYISVRRLPPFFEHKYRIVYSRVELVKDPAQIEHPAVRGVLQDMGCSEGLEIHHDADLPARSGMGSSSSFTVGLLNAVHALNGKMVSKDELSREAIRIEQEVLRENVGWQDQIWAAHGGLNVLRFSTDENFSVTPITVNRDRRQELEKSLLLVFTGFTRIASDVAKAKIDNLSQRYRHVALLTQMVDEALQIITDDRRNLADLGVLLHESWQLKRELSNGVSTARIDQLYETAMQHGALGGKLLGAGGGGFMLFFVPPERRQELRDHLGPLISVPFQVDYDGSKVVVYQPDFDWGAA
jgi:D-glycero-alpha-D-manno-heptose-7-phosphate kinase